MSGATCECRLLCRLHCYVCDCIVSAYRKTSLYCNLLIVDKLQQRENEMKETEEKYKKYLEKAKAVINKMETSQNADPNVSPQLDMLRVSQTK